MKAYIEERAVEIANYIIEHKATVRQAAKYYGISKSTVHKDITDRLCQVNPALAAETRKIIDVNKLERHIQWWNGNEGKNMHIYIWYRFSAIWRVINENGMQEEKTGVI